MDGFARWYEDQHPRVLLSVAILADDLDTARDVTAEAFSRALERWEDVGAMESPAGWTYTVALNLMRRRHRRSMLQSRLLRRAVAGRPPAVELLSDTRADVARAIQALPARARTAVVLRYIGDLTESQVAEAMGVAPGTVAATLSGARRRLAVLLADYSPTEDRRG